MASTGLVTDSDMTKRLSQSYVFKGNGFVPIEKHEDNRKLPVGIATNVFSTAEDLSKYGYHAFIPAWKVEPGLFEVSVSSFFYYILACS